MLIVLKIFFVGMLRDLGKATLLRGRFFSVELRIVHSAGVVVVKTEVLQLRIINVNDCLVMEDDLVVEVILSQLRGFKC